MTFVIHLCDRIRFDTDDSLVNMQVNATINHKKSHNAQYTNNFSNEYNYIRMPSIYFVPFYHFHLDDGFHRIAGVTALDK